MFTARYGLGLYIYIYIYLRLMSLLRTKGAVATVLATAGSHNTDGSQISAAANTRQSQCGGNLSVCLTV